MDNLISELSLLSAYDPTEKEMISRMILFIEENANCMSQELSSGHLTGSSWIVNKERTKVLMTHHAKLGMWLQLGGHAESTDFTIRDTAIREAREESGLQSVRLLSKDILSVDIHKIPERKGFPEHFHYDVQYLLEADENEALMISEESKDLRWVKFDEMASYNNELSILRMLNKSQQYLGLI